MPLVKKDYQLRQVQQAIKYFLELPMNTSTQALELSLLRQLIQLEVRLLTQLWTSPSTMPNLARMRQYRASLLENRLVGTEIT